MLGFSLRKNMVFDWNGEDFRIDRLPATGDVLLERLKDGHLQITARTTLLADYASSKIVVKENVSATARSVPIYSRPLCDLTEEVRLQTKRRQAYLDALTEGGSPTFTKRFTLPIIERVAKEIGDSKPPSSTTLFRWHSRYRVHRDGRSLVPRFDRRGSRLLRQDERVLQLATEAMDEAFKASPRAGGNDIYILLKGKIALANQRQIGGPTLRAPSLRTVYRLLNRVDSYDLSVMRQGKRVADQRHRIHKAGTVTQHILERVEVDHTPLDLFLICDKTWLPLGRPLLTMLIDHFSRMPLGYFLSYGNASAGAVMGAMRHAILPKPPIVETIPGLKVEHEWNCYGVPDLLVVDNGLEFHGVDLESVAFDLSMRIQYCPKHTPRFKGTIERYLKTINYFFVHQLPGTSMARLHERGDYDSAKHALLTLAEFLHLFEKWLVDVYAQTQHRTTCMTPCAKWHEGLSRREPELPCSVSALQQRIGLVDERSVRRDGVWLNSIRYTGDILSPIVAKFGEGVRVRVLHDDQDLGEIQVWAPDAQDPVTVPALDYAYAKGLTAVQHDLICASLREQGFSMEDREARDRAKFEIAQTIQELMRSRKQRHRRQAGALRGLTSTKAGTALGSAKEPKNRVKPLPTLPAKPVEVPVPLGSFKLPRQEGGHV